MPDRRRGVPRRKCPARRRSATTMRIGYLDCASGASGDMLLGALLGAGWTEAALRDLIGRLGVPVRIAVGRVHRQSVPAVRVEVQETEPPRSRRYPVLARVLADASLEPALRDSAAGVLRRLAAAEAEIHATPIEEVHLHELGGVDTLLAIVGVLAGVRGRRAGAAGPSDEERAGRVAVRETSIDDMNPQLYPHVTARLLDAGALDVMTIPAVMKKGRPGHLLRVLAPPDRVRALYGILLAETTTLGVRVYEVSRLAARRRRVEVQTEYGAVPIKIAEDRSGVLNMAPEFDVCRALAERHGVPLKRVLAAAQRAAEAIEPRVLRG